VSLVIRIATEADAPEICETHTRAIRELCAKDYTSEQLEAWAGPRKATDYLGPIRNERLYVAEESGRVIGFGQYYEVNKEICAIYVHPDFVRRGVARTLFKKVTEELRAKGLSRAWLDASLTSVPFYLAMGCREIEEQDHALGSGDSIPCVKMGVDL